MTTIIRPIAQADGAECGRILYAGFAAISDKHGFPSDFPSVDVANGVMTMLIGHPDFHGVVAERDGRVLGSNFVEIRSPIAGIGPITVDPAAQNGGVGRGLMQAVMDHAGATGASGVRLVQAAYHNRSLCLYTRLGFRSREMLSVLQGPPLDLRFAGYTVRPATLADMEACNRLCQAVHGFDRGRELAEAVSRGSARLVEHLGRITGYATGTGFFFHAVTRTNQDLQALLGAATEFAGLGILLPTRNHEMFEWCLNHGLRLMMQATLMSIGLYNEPEGTYLPSILY